VNSVRTTIGFVLLTLLALSACADPLEPQLNDLATYYVDRLVDSLSPDSGGPVAMDSMVIDSLVGDWTPDEWQRFWERVEKERRKRAEAARIIAEREAEEIKRRAMEMKADTAADSAS